MRWQGGRVSANVEDRRGMRAGPVAIGGGIGTVILVLFVMLLGGDPQALLQQIERNQPPAAAPVGPGGEFVGDPAEEELKRFVSVTLADTEDVWDSQFRSMGEQYQRPKLVLFSDEVQSAC